MAGGLGNQLFQFSAGKLVAGNTNIELVYGVYPVRPLDVTTEIFADNPSEKLQISHIPKKGFLYRKVLNFALRRSAVPTRYGIDKKFLSWAISTIGLFSNRRWDYYFINNGLGWDKKLIDVPKKSILIGYFQSHFVGIAGKESLTQMLAKTDLPEVTISKEKLIMIHIRLTDYLESDSLGHLISDYYIAALDKFDTLISYQVFTDGSIDDLTSQHNFIDTSRVVHTYGLNSWQVLKLMTQAEGFIIANSSFSWWAATLGAGQNQKVVAPKVWFQGNSPVEIHDPAWDLI